MSTQKVAPKLQNSLIAASICVLKYNACKSKSEIAQDIFSLIYIQNSVHSVFWSARKHHAAPSAVKQCKQNSGLESNGPPNFLALFFMQAEFLSELYVTLITRIQKFIPFYFFTSVHNKFS